MQVSSYTFQSPYPQQVQIGRPDPSSSKAQDQSQIPAVLETPKSIPKEGKTGSVSGSEVSVSLQALQSGNAQSGVAEFKSLSTTNQAQKVYTES